MKRKILSWFVVVAILATVIVVGMTILQQGRENKQEITETQNLTVIERLRPGQRFDCGDNKEIGTFGIIVTKEWFKENYGMNPEQTFCPSPDGHYEIFGLLAPYEFYRNNSRNNSYIPPAGYFMVDTSEKRRNEVMLSFREGGEVLPIGTDPIKEGETQNMEYMGFNVTIKLVGIELDVIEENGIKYPICPIAVILVTRR